MIKQSLLDVLKDNRRIDTEEFPMAIAIEDMQGFVKRPSGVSTINSDMLSIDEKAELEIMQIYVPLFARFQPKEIEQLFNADIKNILAEKKRKGLK
tara:strand:+ start:800 stop:1087 length:288 start_codon:yes stop_codon:yes gene_type:complete